MAKSTRNHRTSSSSYTAPTGTLATNGLYDEEKLFKHVTDRTQLLYEQVTTFHSRVTAVEECVGRVQSGLRQHIDDCIKAAVEEIAKTVWKQLVRTKDDVCSHVSECMPTSRGKLLDEHFKAEIAVCNQLVGIAQRAVNGAGEAVASLEKTCGCDGAVKF